MRLCSASLLLIIFSILLHLTSSAGEIDGIATEAKGGRTPSSGSAVPAVKALVRVLTVASMISSAAGARPDGGVAVPQLQPIDTLPGATVWSPLPSQAYTLSVAGQQHVQEFASRPVPKVVVYSNEADCLHYGKKDSGKYCWINQTSCGLCVGPPPGSAAGAKGPSYFPFLAPVAAMFGVASLGSPLGANAEESDHEGSVPGKKSRKTQRKPTRKSRAAAQKAA